MTAVIAFPEGAASELVVDGETGFLVSDESEMADAVARLDQIDPARCRELTAQRFDVAAVTRRTSGSTPA
jgi:glycosyltransferase involved in cell wall biosynthesis